MFPRKLTKWLKSPHNLICNNISKRYCDQAVVTMKMDKSLKVSKKPSRPPFMKNIFLGVFDKEMLTYPELEKVAHEDLKEKFQPYKDYFKANVDSKVVSSLKKIPSEILESCKNLGLFGQTIPSEYGGNEQTATETAYVNEVIAKDLDLALVLYSHNFLAVQSLLLYGSPKQKEKYLPLLASGEWISAFCMSESNGGSDIASFLTKIVPSETHSDLYFLNGKKQWVLNASNTNLFVVLAMSNVNTHVGKTMPALRIILVEKDSPGLTISEPQEHVGLNASSICEVQFKDTPVHTDNFIGGEYQGFDMCVKVLNSGRYNIGAITVSLFKNLLNIASDFISNREQFEKPLNQCELIQKKIVDISAYIYALESMVYLTTGILDRYENPDCLLELAIIKVFSFTEGRRCLDLLMELLGGRAFLMSEVTQKYFRDFRTMEVFDGTTDIANLFISLNGLQHAGLTMQETVSKMRKPYEYPNFILKRIFSSRRQNKDDPALNLHLYEQLHPTLRESANLLEYCVLRFEYAVHIAFTRYGRDLVNEQLELMRLADAAVKIYAMTAVLGRSSRSYCIGLPNAETEIRLANKLCNEYKTIVQAELNTLIDGFIVSGDLQTLQIGPDIFRHHGYFLEHPLERSY